MYGVGCVFAVSREKFPLICYGEKIHGNTVEMGLFKKMKGPFRDKSASGLKS